MKKRRVKISRSVGDGSINRLGNVPKETASQRDTLAAIKETEKARDEEETRKDISCRAGDESWPTSSDASMETANERVFLEAVGIRLLNGLFLDDMSRLPRETVRLPDAMSIIFQRDEMVDVLGIGFVQRKTFSQLS
ncbi:uncharacterized protein EV420DRAFT_1486492 [Desarmillaria tabescens]|uniref:Uncharacterized protein n=1 Tax=Armillaria tabescens TaxID=1929756 RepID=A0AA39JA70_ARMTA|nr:uncharacterized protein EV420DRAFT_1486492 [Desarmillaria tabescens]KAK0439030.1 hypothetical protein EV420DRAFT_1486492 [Desarmillaria tabescens]